MNLKRCLGCNKIIDVDGLEDVDLNSTIGCGLKEDDFDSCTNCAGENNSNECKDIRKVLNMTKTTIKEYYEAKLQ